MSGSKDTAGSLAETIAQGVAPAVKRLIDEAIVTAKIETIHTGYGAGWQCANHAWQVWLEKNIPDWDAMKGVDLTTVPRADMHLTEQADDATAEADRPAQEPEITEEMTEAGAEVLLGELGGAVSCFWSAPDLANRVYQAMRAAEATDGARGSTSQYPRSLINLFACGLVVTLLGVVLICFAAFAGKNMHMDSLGGIFAAIGTVSVALAIFRGQDIEDRRHA